MDTKYKSCVKENETIASMAGKMPIFPGTNKSFPPVLLNFPPFLYVFLILEVKIPSKCQNFPGTRFLSSLFFPGMIASNIFA